MLNKIYFLMFISLINQIYSDEWSNWALNQKCNPKNIFKPKDQKELIDILKKTKQKKEKFRVVASGHSWSDIVCPSRNLIDIGNLNKVINVDKKNNTMTVEAGIKICDLNNKLAKSNLSLPNQSAIDEQTIGGAIATATHGFGKTGTLSDFVKEISLITPDGKIHTFSDKNKKYLAAAKVNIGSLGIVTKVTLQCEPLFELEKKHFALNFEDFIKLYKKLYSDNDFFAFTWNPYKNIVTVLLENKVYKKDMKAIKMSETCFQGTKIGNYQMRRQESEIAISAADLPKTLEKLRKFFLKKEKKGLKISGKVLCRFVNQDKNSLLSPTFDRDSVFISINMLPEKGIDYKKFLQEYEDLLVNEFNGRPHWGKINFLGYEKAKKLYGKNLDEFIKIRKELDPDGILSNSFTERVLKS